MRATASGAAPENPETEPTPTDRKVADGQCADHWVLSPDECASGFKRPVRCSYQHVGIAGPKYTLRDLTDEERANYGHAGYVKFERYPPGAELTSAIGRYWTQAQLDKVGKGCGVVTAMGRAIAETYARQPGYYGSTWCCGCRQYLPVGRNGEFVWDGTDDRVGT